MGKKSKRRGKQKAGRRNAQQRIQETTNHVPEVNSLIKIPDNCQLVIKMPFVTDSLVAAVFERGGLPEHLNSFEDLKSCLDEAFVGKAAFALFFQALAEGLEKGQPIINQLVQLIPGTPDKMTLLHWVCQYGFLNQKFDFQLSDDIVSLVLKAGADPNAIREDNQTTPLFFAVKYTSLQTIDMLLEAGANIYQRDMFGKTCLINALERPKPIVLRRLLEYLPATEMIPSAFSPEGEKFLSSAVDLMLDWATSLGVPPQSWPNLGVPATDDILEAFMIIRQKGARLTQRGTEFSIKTISVSVGNPTHPQLKYPELLQKLAEVLVGTYIPENCRSNPEELIETDNGNVELEGEPQDCPICLGNVRKSVTLYCGHIFCRECILEHGKGGAVCPMCRVPLCRDVSANGSGKGLISNLLGIDQKALARSGPKFFTNEQVEAEAKAQGIHNNFSSCERFRENLEIAIENGKRSSQEMKLIEVKNVSNVRHGGQCRDLSGRGRHKLELASNLDLVLGSPPSSFNICPKDGMVSIEVSINSIPLLARISNQSFYTVLSRSMVDQLGLKRIDKLKSRKFVDCGGYKLSGAGTICTCLEPVKVCFQGIEVTLRNAIEISPDPEPFLTTVQLGHDFLNSGLLSVIDVQVNKEGSYYRVVAEDAWPVSNVAKESFRYYSHDGKMADLPLIHFDPFQGHRKILTITLKAKMKFNQCNWCCRGFPDGMAKCSGCGDAYYCDERCQRAARRIHKLTCGIENESEGG